MTNLGQREGRTSQIPAPLEGEIQPDVVHITMGSPENVAAGVRGSG